MIETLVGWDVALFYFFNVNLANPVFDVIMPIITNKWTWLPVWLAVIFGLLWKGGKRGRIALIIAILAVGSADAISHRVLKKNIQRIRPCNALENVHLTVNKTSSYSMPSNHAANFFALATVFSFYYRRFRGLFYSLAALVAYSRIAVGVHYPLDALAGAAVGTSLALLMIYIWYLLARKWPLLAIANAEDGT